MTTNLIAPDAGIDLVINARGRDALTHLAEKLAAVDPTQFTAFNFEPSLAISRALGVAPAVAALRERIRTECPRCKQEAIDELEERAYAAATANGDYEAATSPPVGFSAVLNDVFEARGVLLAVAKGLVACNLMKDSQLSKLIGGRGQREAASDVLTLVSAFERDWARLESKCPFTRDVLARQAGLAEKLLQLLGIRDQNPERTAAAADLRMRVFTLLDEAYDNVRRAVTYLRWEEGDADAVAPPLRSRPVTRKPDAKDDATNATPAPTALPADKAAPVTSDATHNLDATGIPQMAPTGLPRSDPYGKR